MSADSYQAGFARSREDALVGRPQPEPRKVLADADEGYRNWAAGLVDGYRAGTAERHAREATAA